MFWPSSALSADGSAIRIWPVAAAPRRRRRRRRKLIGIERRRRRRPSSAQPRRAGPRAARLARCTAPISASTDLNARSPHRSPRPKTGDPSSPDFLRCACRRSQRRARPSYWRTVPSPPVMMRCGLRSRSVTACSMRLIERRLSCTSASTSRRPWPENRARSVGDRAEPGVQRVGDLLEGLQRLAGVGHHALGLARAEQVVDLDQDAVDAHRGLRSAAASCAGVVDRSGRYRRPASANLPVTLAMSAAALSALALAFCDVGERGAHACRIDAVEHAVDLASVLLAPSARNR